MRSSLANTAVMLLALTATSANAVAAEPKVIEPKGPWTVDFADESCAIQRAFGSGADLYRLEMRQYQPDGATEVMVSGPFRGRASNFQYAFLPDASMRDMGPPELGKAGNGDAVIRFTTASIRTVEGTADYYKQANNADGKKGAERVPIWTQAERKARASAVHGLTIHGLFSPDITLQTGDMASVMGVMDKCLDQLVAGWKLDPAAQRSLSRRPTLQGHDLGRKGWSALEDVMKRTRSARTRVLFMIGAAGGIESCRLLGPAQGSAEGAKLCEVLGSQMSFQPAIGADGTPVASYFLDEISIRVVSPR